MSDPGPFDVYDHRGIVDPALVAEEQAGARTAFRLDPQRLVLFAQLDGPGRELAERARRARDAVLRSRVFAGNLLDRTVGEAELRLQEWDIAVSLRRITELRAQLARYDGAGAVGPLTAEVLAPQERVLRGALDSVIARVEALERYAGQVRAADTALGDWERALEDRARADELARLNDQFLDLAARTATDSSAMSELKSLGDQAAITEEALRRSLREASLAAEALAFP